MKMWKRRNIVTLQLDVALKATDDQESNCSWILNTVLGSPGFLLREWNNVMVRTACDGPWAFELRKQYSFDYLFFIHYVYSNGRHSFLLWILDQKIVFIFARKKPRKTILRKKKLLITFILATSCFLLGYGPIAVFHTMNVFFFSGKRQKCPHLKLMR